VIDLHSHILPGLDDGVATVEEARQLAKRAAAEGVTAIAATPHVRDDYPTTAEQMEDGVATLRDDFRAAGIGVDVLHGGELALEEVTRLEQDELRRFSLAQSNRYLLLEFPYTGWPLMLESVLAKVQTAGLIPILAHPERNREVQERPERLEAIVAGGTLVQVTAASLDGRLGKSSQRTARTLLEHGAVHLLASDAHGPSIREAGLAAAAAALRDEALARHLTTDAPAAIVAGDPLPRRPLPQRRRPSFRRR